MTEIKATTMATEVATQHGITRNAAFDAILVTAGDLGITARRFTEKQAAEIEAIIAQSVKAGTVPTLTRPTI